MKKKNNDAYKAFSLYLRGYDTKQIAAECEISEATAKDWVATRKEVVKKHIEEIKGEDYVNVVVSRFEELRQLAFDDYLESHHSADKARFIKVMLDIQKMEISVLQDIGALKKTPMAHDHKHDVSGSVAHTHTHTLLPEKLDGAELESLAAMLIAETMGLTPKQALSLGGRFSDPSRPYLIAEDDPRVIDIMEEMNEDLNGKSVVRKPLLVNPLEPFLKID